MSDAPNNRDDVLHQHLRQSAQDALGDWTFSSDMRAAVLQQVRQQQRVSTWAKAGRAARDAGWLVAAAAVVFMLATHNAGSAPNTPAAATQAPTAYSAAAASPSPAGTSSAANQPAAPQPAPPSSAAPRAADSVQTNGQAGPASTPAVPEPSAQSPTTAVKVLTAGSASTDTHPAASTTPPGDTAKAASEAPTGALTPRVSGSGGDVNNTIGVASAASTFVQTLPAPQVPANKPLLAADLPAANQSGVALQALPGELLVYSRAGNTLLVRAFTPDLQSQWAWAVPADVQGVPQLQTKGILVFDRGILFWHDREVTLRDLNGSQRQLLTAGDDQQIRGLHMTGSRWLTIVGTSGGDPAAWLVDLDANRVVGLKLSHDTLDAIALDGTRLCALDAKSQLLLFALPAMP